MNAIANRQFRLAARPIGLPRASDWTLVEEPVREPAEGEFLIRIEYVSLDPAMRGWMNEGKSYVPPVAIGEVMRAYSAGEVVASNNPKFPLGSRVAGVFGVQQYAISDGKGARIVDTALAPLPTYLSVLGMTGMTAYFGLLEVGAAKQGDTVVVSGAAGAVGTVVGQIARIKGCRVVGIAGGAEKCRWLVDDLGFDAAIDYKADDVAARLRELCPDGIDVYFDNVGGEILDACLANLALNARVVCCGAISAYNDRSEAPGLKNYFSLITRRARMEGFLILDYQDRFAEAQGELFGWVVEGKLKHSVHVVDGLEHAPDALNLLFTGGNTGKVIVKLKD